jgi:hypothetical protein
MVLLVTEQNKEPELCLCEINIKNENKHLPMGGSRQLVMCRLGLKALSRPSRAQALKAVAKASKGSEPGLQVCQALGRGFRPWLA